MIPGMGVRVLGAEFGFFGVDDELVGDWQSRAVRTGRRDRQEYWAQKIAGPDFGSSWFGSGGGNVYVGLIRVLRECQAWRSVFWYATYMSVTWLLTLYLVASEPLVPYGGMEKQGVTDFRAMIDRLEDDIETPEAFGFCDL